MSIQILGSAIVRGGADFRIENFPVAPKTYLDRASALALAGASLALQNAQLQGPLGEDFGLITVTAHGCVETMRLFESALHEKGAKAASPLLFSHSYFNSPAAILAIEWGIQGYHAPLVGADYGVALDLARDVLESGHAEKILVGAFEAQSIARSFGEESEISNQREGAIFLVLQRGEGDDETEKARAILESLAP